MSGLNRHRAPISERAWEAIDSEARRTLKVVLAGRRVVDFSGPRGYEHSSVNLGRVQPLDDAPAPGVHAGQRVVQPLVELRVPFSLSRRELETIDRGNPGPDLDAVVEAARRIAHAEDRIVFDGYPAASIRGVAAACEHKAIEVGDDITTFPERIARAITVLTDAGVAGDYALVVGDNLYRRLAARTEGGYPLIQHIRKVHDGPLIHGRSLNGALLISLRSGDFELVVGRDVSVGYLHDTADEITFYLEETLSFLVHGPEAAVVFL